jgi:hypothetical protein
MRRPRHPIATVALPLAFAGAAVACGVFELGDVVPAADADAGGGVPDGAACVGDGDPCSCLPEPFTVSPPPRGSGVALTLSGGQVYFMVSNDAAGGGDAIYRVPADGSAAPVLVMPASPASPPLVVAGGYVFMRKLGTGLGVLRVPSMGPAQSPVLAEGPLTLAPTDLAGNDESLFWGNASGAICTAQVDGGIRPPDTLDSGCSSQPFAPPRPPAPPGAVAVAVSPTSVLWTGGMKLWRAPVDDGASAVDIVTQAGGSPLAVAEVGARVFWFFWPGADAGSLWSASEDGGGADRIVPVVVPEHAIPSLVVDGDGAYWSERNYPRLVAAGLDGTNVRVLACEDGITAVATDGAYVYWLTSTGAVRRLPKMP